MLCYIIKIDVILHVILDEKRKHVCHTFFKKFDKTLVSIVILISTTGYIALTSIYNYLPLLFILNFLYPQQVPQQVLVLFLSIIFIPDGYVPFVILPGFYYYSFSLTSITGHGSTKKHSKGSPALKT